MTDLESKIEHARNIIGKSNGVFIITGAGVSAESGVPTFRDPGGFWKEADPNKVATPEAFSEDPKYVWEWYDARRTQLKTVKPNPAHYAIAQLEKEKSHFFLLTQNVDDLHERAGSTKLAHIHGRIWEVRCVKEGIIREDFRAPMPELPPRCERCGALERPNVVWFGELINEKAITMTEAFLSEGQFDVAIIIGTEASFGYIIDWAARARGNSGNLIEINPGMTGLSVYVDMHLRGRAGEILPRIIPPHMEGKNDQSS